VWRKIRKAWTILGVVFAAAFAIFFAYDLGGRTTEYCKGDYRASLQYPGQSAKYGWVFALDLSWGLDSLVDRWRGRTCRLDRNA